MKMVCTHIEDDVHRKLKIYLVDKGETIRMYIHRLIMEDIATEQSEIDDIMERVGKRHIDLQIAKKQRQEEKIKKLEEKERHKKQAADEFRKKAEKEYARYGMKSPFDKKGEDEENKENI